MASLVVGLFERRTDAEAALTDLVNNDFDRAHIEIKETYSENSQDSLAHVRRELEGEGVPESDAKLYEEGIRAGDTLEVAHVADDKAELAREIMNRHGALDIHDAFLQRSTPPAILPVAGAVAAASALGATKETNGEIVVPVVEEELQVGKREIQRGGVRVFQRVEERRAEESVTLREEKVTVERVAVDRAVTSADAAFQKTADVVVTETSEVPVVGKTSRVVEEVVVGKTEEDRVETVRETVRRTDVEIDELTTDTTIDKNKRI